MKIDWDTVKKQTLWSYEDLIAKLQEALSFPFVQEHYNHAMTEAQCYAAQIRRGYLHDEGEMVLSIDAAAAHLSALGAQWNGTYADLVCSVGTRAECEGFLRKTGLPFENLVHLLNYLLRWVLPFKTPLREFIDVESHEGARWYAALARQGIKTNLDLLEAGRTEAGRARVASATGIPQADLLALVHRADISRLAYVRGKTVRHLCGGGYDTLEKIAGADLPEMERNMDAYYRTLGKTAADFKAVIPLTYMIGGARTVPRVLTA